MAVAASSCARHVARAKGEFAVDLDTAALVAATSLTVTERHYTRMLCACRLQTFVTGASGGAWTWEDIEATLAP
jgi:hypothetical protein